MSRSTYERRRGNHILRQLEPALDVRRRGGRGGERGIRRNKASQRKKNREKEAVKAGGESHKFLC